MNGIGSIFMSFLTVGFSELNFLIYDWYSGFGFAEKVLDAMSDLSREMKIVVFDY